MVLVSYLDILVIFAWWSTNRMVPACRDCQDMTACVWPLCDECWSIFLHSLSSCSASSQRRCVWKALVYWINRRKWKSCFVQSHWKLASQDNVCLPQILPLLFLYLEFLMVLSSYYTLQVEWQCDRKESDLESFVFYIYIQAVSPKQCSVHTLSSTDVLCQTSKTYEFLVQWYKHWISSLDCLFDGL